MSNAGQRANNQRQGINVVIPPAPVSGGLLNDDSNANPNGGEKNEGTDNRGGDITISSAGNPNTRAQRKSASSEVSACIFCGSIIKKNKKAEMY